MSERRAIRWRREEHGILIGTCPGCGREGSLPKNLFRVEPSGNLEPSFDCPHCPFHEFVRLAALDAPAAGGGNP